MSNNNNLCPGCNNVSESECQQCAANMEKARRLLHNEKKTDDQNLKDHKNNKIIFNLKWKMEHGVWLSDIGNIKIVIRDNGTFDVGHDGEGVLGNKETLEEAKIYSIDLLNQNLQWIPGFVIAAELYEALDDLLTIDQWTQKSWETRKRMICNVLAKANQRGE